MTPATNAAHALEGRTLNGRWKVVRKLSAPAGATGGFFSVGYIVKDDDGEAFLKALNFHAFFQLFPGRNIVEILREQTDAFEYERHLLLKVKGHNLSKVSMLLDEGQEQVDGFPIPQVPFLIFEIADGDVRSTINFSAEVDLAWKLKSLHDVAVGLKQLHGINVGHQDLKPSNVLLYNNRLVSKLGDLGRSLSADRRAPHEKDDGFPGDFNYAPPEFIYQYIVRDLHVRMRATDVYLFGSLVVFYFTGTTMNALLYKNMNPLFRWDVWSGTFQEVTAYLIDAFHTSLTEFRQNFTDPEFGEELKEIVRYCCFPDPAERGHPKGLKIKSEQYEFIRIITRFDVLSKKAEIRVR